MRSFRNTSIRRKQMLIIMLITSVALLLACATFVSFETINFRKEMVRNLSTLAQIIGHNTAAALDFNDPQSAGETLLALKAQPHIYGACVFSRNGTIFAKYGRSGGGISFTPPPRPRAAGYSFGHDRLTLFEPISSKGDIIGLICLESDMQALRAELTQFAAITAAIYLLTLLVAFLLSARLLRLISEPILELVQTARAVAQDKNYSIRVIKRSADEIGVLMDSFNEMLEQIQHRDAALESAREGLEARVAERTAELAKANEALQAENAERKRNEDQLRVQGTALNAVAHAIVITDRHGAIQSVNPAFTTLTGYTAQEVLGKNPRLLKSGLQDGFFYRTLWQTISGGQAWSGQVTNRRKDGSLYVEDMTITPLRNADGLIARYIAVKQDVTARGQAESILRKSEEKFRQLAETISDVFWMTSADLKQVHYVSPAYERIWGREPARLVEHPQEWAEAIPLEERNRVLASFRRLSEGEASVSLEYRIARPDGEMRWIHSRGFPVRDATGKVTKLTGIASDITGRKLAETARDRLAAILESTTDLVGMVDAAGQLIYLNRSGRNLVDVGLEEDITTCSIREFLPNPDSHPDLTVGIPTAIREGTWRGETAIVSRRGQEIPVSQVILSHKNPDGKIEFLSTIMRDMTERNRDQLAMEHIHQQLVEASRLAGMSEIATNVLHNVGNALNSVNISTDLIADSVKRSKASSLARVVTLLQEHAHDLGAFITNDPGGRHVPLHLARLSEHLLAEQAKIAGELDLLRRNVEHIKEVVAMQQSYATIGGVKEMTDLTTLVEDSMRLNEDALRRHGVEIVREFEKVPLMNVEKHKILQILVNLVRNAKYACDESGRAESRVTVRLSNGEGRMKISVMDNGIGIPPENLTRIFNYGFTTRKNGHGFGLHSSALAARELGGSLTVHSDGPGHGASFTLELPCPTHEKPHE
jgi:PAS domain S-box-containing protein